MLKMEISAARVGCYGGGADDQDDEEDEEDEEEASWI